MTTPRRASTVRWPRLAGGKCVYKVPDNDQPSAQTVWVSFANGDLAKLQVAVHFASNDATPSRRSDRRAHIKPSSYEAVIASSGAWRAGRRARRCKARTKIDIDEQRHGDLAERTLRVAEVVAERRERGPTVQRRGVLSRGTCSPGKGKPGGVPSPKGRPPSASRPWGSSQLAKSGPAGTIWVGFTEVWTT